MTKSRREREAEADDRDYEPEEQDDEAVPQDAGPGVTQGEAQPLTPAQVQHYNELLAKSQSPQGLTQEEHDEMEDLHAQHEAYASAWVAEPDRAFLDLFQAVQLIANAVRWIVDSVPAASGLSGMLERIDASLLQSGRNVIEPVPLPDVPPMVAAPVNVDVPHVSGQGMVGQTLNCTMGNWQNEPTSYAYQWKSDATDVGTGAESYQVASSDVGHSVHCVVTATNQTGSTPAPPSNAVVVS